MHVLAIHMNAMPTVSLSAEWAALTEPAKEASEEDEAEQHPDPTLDDPNLQQLTTTSPATTPTPPDKPVPLLLQDPLTLMLHFILSLPVNIEKGAFVRQN